MANVYSHQRLAGLWRAGFSDGHDHHWVPPAENGPRYPPFRFLTVALRNANHQVASLSRSRLPLTAQPPPTRYAVSAHDTPGFDLRCPTIHGTQP